MTAKIGALVITLLIDIAVGSAILVGMVVAMNGYSESDAMWGFGAYILLALVIAISASAGGFLLTGSLINKQFSPIMSALVAISAFSIVGIVLEIVATMIGIGIAEFVRVNY